MIDIENLLKTRNLRVTTARKTIFKALASSEHAMSPGEVFSEVKKTAKTNSDLVSVYRNLSLFSEIGIVHKFQDGRYALCQHHHAPDQKEHIHIVINCEKCGLTSEIHEQSGEVFRVSEKIKSMQSSLRELSSIVLQGTCEQCSDQK